MDIHGYPRKNDMDMDMDMDGIFLIHGKPDQGRSKQIFIGAAKWMFINEHIKESMGIA